MKWSGIWDRLHPPFVSSWIILRFIQAIFCSLYVPEFRLSYFQDEKLGCIRL